MKKQNSKKYAYALFQLAEESQGVDAVTGALLKFRALSNKETVSFFKNPFIDEEEKKKLVRDLSAGIPEMLLKLMFMLIEKREMHLLPEIERKYNDFVNRSRNIMVANVASAVPLGKPVIEKIKNSIKKITGREISVIEKIDKTLIGGIVVRTDDLLFDGSVKGKINLLKQEFLNEI